MGSTSSGRSSRGSSTGSLGSVSSLGSVFRGTVLSLGSIKKRIEESKISGAAGNTKKRSAENEKSRFVARRVARWVAVWCGPQKFQL